MFKSYEDILTTTEENIKDYLENVIDDVFYHFQEIEGITSGDIDFGDAFDLDDATEKLAKIIHKVLAYQKLDSNPPENDDYEVCWGCEIVSVEVDGEYGFFKPETVEHEKAVAICLRELDTYTIYELSESVCVCDLVNYLNDPDNSCKGSSTAGFKSREDAEKYWKTLELI